MIYIMLKGDVRYVLAQYENIDYIKIDKGDLFGVIDIIGNSKQNEFDPLKWIE